MKKYGLLSYILCNFLVGQDVDSRQLSVIETVDRSTTTSIDTINSEFLEHIQANNLTQIFNSRSDISVGGGSNVAQKVYIRGIEDRLFHVSVDGVTQSGNTFHHQGNILIDPLMIKTLQIFKGVSPSSIGPGALAGSLIVKTKDANDFLSPDKHFGFFLSSGGFSNAGIQESIAFFGSDHKHFDALIYYNYVDTFFYRDGMNALKNFSSRDPATKVLGSNSLRHNVLLKANAYFSNDQKLTFSYNMVFDSAIRPFRTNIGNTFDDEEPNLGLIIFNNKNSIHNLSLNYQKESESFSIPSLDFNTYASIRNVHLTPFSIPQEALEDEESKNPRNIFLNNFGVDLRFNHQNQTQFSNFIGYGINYQGITARDFDQTIITPMQKGRENTQIIGGYVQGSYSIKNLIFMLGSRYDSYFYNDKNSNQHHNWGFSPSASITYTPLSGLDLILSYSYVTRGPLPRDTSLIQESNSFVDPKIKSEKSSNLELDLNYNTKFGEHFLGLSASGFYQNIKDFINTYGVGNLSIYNLGYDIYIYGAEAGISYGFKNFSVVFEYSRSFPSARGFLLADTYELGAVSGHTYVLKLNLDIPKYGLNLSWISRFTQRVRYFGYDIYNDLVERVDKPGYAIHSIYVSYQPKQVKHLSLNFGIENLFNRDYFSQTSPFKTEADSIGVDSINFPRSALKEPGINLKLTISYRFQT